MRIISSSAMPEPMRQILAELERTGYVFTCYEQNNGRTFVQFLDEVEIIDTGKVEPCDTTIYIKKVTSFKPPLYSDRAIFATFICHAIEGNGAESFHRAIDILNYKAPIGKFVRDCDEGTREVFCVTNQGETYLTEEVESQSPDILYVSSCCVTHLNSELLAAHLEYHNKMKMKVFPMLERLRTC
ncbi:MAG: hypothetical protein KME26_05350 [Oscillatoria princeps RMCB-10]|jgi:hypothetical protein|nr:hypothetical protein [Oscillatoria princeps RMCB-10]